MINLNNVSFAYSKKKEVFSNLNLTLQPGSIYGLLGKNGAGKTTLLKMMCGLATPSAGSCTTLGEKAASKNPSLMRELFFLPEEFYMPDMRISKFVSLNAPFYPEFDIKQFHRYLTEFEISPENSLRALSYGEKKKVNDRIRHCHKHPAASVRRAYQRTRYSLQETVQTDYGLHCQRK